MRSVTDQAFASRTPAVAAHHIGCCAHFIDEDQTLRINLLLVSFPEPTGQCNITAFLFTGEQAFF